MGLIARIISSFSFAHERGLPIGSLTSQHFANFYLNPFDRFITEELKSGCHARYMDDVVWWCRSKREARRSLQLARDFLRINLGLLCNERMVQVGRSCRGITFCGFRVFPGSVRLTRRKMRRYGQLRRANEASYKRGEIGSLELQFAYEPLSATVRQADSLGWRQQEHIRHGVTEA